MCDYENSGSEQEACNTKMGHREELCKMQLDIKICIVRIAKEISFLYKII